MCHQIEDTQQQLQQQLLDQVKNTLGTDVFTVASDTSSLANNFFQSGFDLLNQQYVQSLKSLEDPKEKERKEKEEKEKEIIRKADEEKKLAVASQNVSVEALSAQFVSMALQATGKSFGLFLLIPLCFDECQL